ncbi:hypothetical protein N781_11195 [Pontibacillus halophilus JSM 076056 = DSM 19796]|uniref:Stage IV sporulation protein n=1 Tax=Pontibacillus halophilus JSM 076056 = DSM 19796 TaxID=1385510 RepID=A0A0A5GNQ2_9BACI|nr:sporulation protein YqfD [Pontibacillus halophilus]KGX93584.1 hypothetical protein N781_11195 [Pontibacillus halophilus JSM 076056 = DSM 19796]
MKTTQGVFFSGSVTIVVHGEFPEFFFNRCVERGLMIWNVKKIDKYACRATIRLEDIDLLKSIRTGSGYKVRIKGRHGLPFVVRRLWRKKPLLIGLFLSLLMVFVLSNMVWKVEIEGVTPELEHKVTEQLREYGVQPGAWKFSLDNPSELQQRLLGDIRELLWIGITEKGTTYHLQGVEKIIVEEGESGGPQHLIARKKGVIADMYVTRGQAEVSVNDYVEPGDMLVSGIIGGEHNEEVVRAEGEVIAETWYESDVTVPLEAKFNVVTGETYNKRAITFWGVAVPYWGFGKHEYKETHEVETDRAFYFLGWKLPVGIYHKEIWEEEHYTRSQTKEEAIQSGIKQAKKELRESLPLDSIIVAEKILQQSEDNGKVKLNLYFKVHEDIAKSQPITQGD